MVTKLNEIAKETNCELLVIGGDILDVFNPTAEEIELYYDLVALLETRTLIYPGNHEMKTKTKSVLDNLAAETSRCNPLVEVVDTGFRSPDFDIIDFKELHKANWKPQESRLCFTHVRGAIPPHVVPEVDLSLFDCYDMVIAGDLHSYQNTQSTERGTPIIYPGSPLTTSFHRSRTKKTNGCIVVNTETLNYSWHELGDLPQLIRKTISIGEELVSDPYDRVIYEVEGDISELKTVKNSELLDKKINKNVGKPAKLNLTAVESTEEELALYFTEIEKLPKDTVDRLVSKFKDIIPDES